MEPCYNSYSLCFFHSLTASLGGILFGYFMSIYNPLQSYFHTLYSWNQEDSLFYDGIITSIFPFGCMVGSAISSNFTLKFGRRGSMIIEDIIAIFGISLTLIGPIALLIVGRLVVGIAVGIMCTTVPLYVNEITPR